MDEVSQTRDIGRMPTAPIPPIRVEPALRGENENALESGETVGALVEDAMPPEVARRRDRSAFVRRGLAAIARSEAAGDWVPAGAVIAKLEAKVAAARARHKKPSE